jgi:hypothetical protein
MLQSTQNLIEEIDILKTQLGRKTAELTKLQEDCEHNWDIILYEPIVTEKFSMTTGCTDTTTRKTWSRTCTLCGFKDIAYNVTKKKVDGMYPGTIAEIEVPSFHEKVNRIEKVKTSSLRDNLRQEPLTLFKI